MRNGAIKGLLLVAAACCLHFGLQSEEIVVTKITKGSIGVKVDGQKTFKLAKVGDKIPVNAWIMTDDDTDVTLTFYTDAEGGESNSVLQIGSMTKLKITSFDVDDVRARTEVALRTGAIYSRVSKRKKVKNDYRVRTRQVTAAVRGTEHGHSTDSEGTDSFVESGEVEQTNGTGESKSVGAGEQTNDQNESSVDQKVQGSQKSSVFSGSTGSEKSADTNTGSSSNDTPSSNTESGDSNVGGTIQEEMGGEDPGNGDEGGSSSGNSGGGGYPQ